MRRGIALGLLGVVVCAGAACSLSLDGFSGTDGVDASSPSAPPPGTPPPPQTMPPPPDGGDAGEAGADPCAGAIFCDTFDVSALGASWDSVHNAGAGSIALDTAASVSAPNAVVAIVPSGTSGASHYLTKAMAAPTTADLDMELDIRVEAACEGHLVEVGVDGATQYLFHLELDGAGSSVTLSETNYPVDGGTVQNDVANGVPTLPVGTWTHVRLRANVGAKTGEYYANGTLVKTVTLAPLLTSGTPHFKVAVASQDNGVGCSVRMDNVAVRAR
jgi:hypothetical protein